MPKTVNKSKFEGIAEAAGTGAILNMALGGFTAFIIPLLANQPAAIKTLLWWIGAILVVFPLGYILQKFYKRESFSLGVMGLGIGIGVFFLVVTTELVSAVFPFVNLDAMSALQGPGAVAVDPIIASVIPTIAAALMSFILFMWLVIRDN
jgi:hypothetical protein